MKAKSRAFLVRFFGVISISAGIAFAQEKATAQSQTEQKAAETITPPAADAPESCASFRGKWTGIWGYGIGQASLWVTSVDANCVAKIAYIGNPGAPTSYETVEIKNGILEWVCNRFSGGVCVLSRHGHELWARYANPVGGINDAVFKKIE
jgi:hypothetical protein